MLKQRVVTAVVLAVVFVGILFGLPLPLFALFIATALLIAGWEWANLTGVGRIPQRIIYQVVLAALIVGAGFYTRFFETYQMEQTAVINLLLVGCAWWALALLWVQGYPQSALLWGSRFLRGVMGILVLVPAWVALVFLRSEQAGPWLILLMVAAVAAADIGAYFSGKAFGRHKLAPNVSPGKSWEGFIGGLFSAVILAVAVGYLSGGPIWLVVALLVPTVLASVLGDLVESMVKRHRGVKDSSQLLPGHGGLLDRLDSLTAAAPVFALAIALSGWKL